MKPGARSDLYKLLAKVASLELLLGGPLLFSDDLRPLIGKAAAITVVIVPVVLFYVGADALADPPAERSRVTRLRLGILGACLVAPMNLYGIAHVVQGKVRFVSLTIIGIAICTVSLVGYLILARRALRASRAALAVQAASEPARPIE